MSADPRHSHGKTEFSRLRVHVESIAFALIGQADVRSSALFGRALVIASWLIAGFLLVDASETSAACQGEPTRSVQQDRHTDIAVLVEKLGSERYEDRLAAEQALLKLGSESLAALTAAVTSPEPEVAWRAADLVERIALESDEVVLAAISDRLDQVGHESNRPDLVRKSSNLRRLWRRHRTQTAVRQLQSKNAQVIASQSYGSPIAGFAGGRVMVGGPVVVRGGDGVVRVIQNPRDPAANQPNADRRNLSDNRQAERDVGPEAWDEIEADRIGMPHSWITLIDDQPSTQKESEQTGPDAPPVLDRRREEIRRQLVREVWRCKQEHLAFNAAEAKTAIERAEQLRGLGANGRRLEDDLQQAEGFGGNANQIDQLEQMIVGLELADLADDGPIDVIDVVDDELGSASQLSQIWYVTLNADWRGSTDDLKLLQQIENLYWIEINSLAITPEIILEIALLDSIQALTVSDASFDTDWLKALRRVKPELQMTVSGPAYLGVKADIQNDASIAGCAVTEVVQGSGADRAGLRIGDVIVRVNDQPIVDFTDLTLSIANKKAEEIVEVEVQRSGAQVIARAKLGNRDLPLR